MIQFLTHILLVVIFYILWMVYRNHKSRTTNVPPGSYGWPLLGETLSLRRAALDGVPERFNQERIEKHGNPLVFKTSLFGNPTAVMCGPAANKFLFGNENRLVSVWWPAPMRKLLGRSLFEIHGDEAKWIRKMIMSYVGPDAFVTHYGAIMEVLTRRHIENYWKGNQIVTYISNS